jgi:hypothetical protein
LIFPIEDTEEEKKDLEYLFSGDLNQPVSCLWPSYGDWQNESKEALRLTVCGASLFSKKMRKVLLSFCNTYKLY